MQAPRDKWWDEVVKGQPETCEPTWVERRASAVHPLHVGVDRQAEGCAALHRRLPAVGRAHDEVDVRLQAERRVLVHGRRRLGDGAHLHHLRPAGGWRDRDHVRGRSNVSRCRTLLENDPGPQGQRLLHRADRDPFADQGQRRPAGDPPHEVQPVGTAHPRHGRRADQSGSVDVVPHQCGRWAVSDRGYLVADRNRWPPDFAAAGGHADCARLLHVATAWNHGRDRRRDRP